MQNAPQKEYAVSNPKMGYVMKKVKIDAKNLKFFYSDKNERRKLREGKLKSLISSLKKGKHFKAPFVTNLKNDKQRLIDGNHRYEAIETVIKHDPTYEIEVWYAEHKDLTPAEEREVFTAWNIGAKQSADDFVKIHWKGLKYGEEMLRKIPASIYNSKTKIKIKTIAGAHIMAKRQNPYAGHYTNGSQRLIKDLDTLEPTDITIMRAFVLDMTDVFGTFDKDYPFWKSIAVNTLYRIWYDNRRLPRDQVLKAWRKLFLGETRRVWEELASSGGRTSEKTFYDMALTRLNEVRGVGKIEFARDMKPKAK